MDNTDPKRMRELAPDEALRRLASVPVGRIVFTQRALPAIRPVNHLWIDGAVVVRTHVDAAVLTAAGQVVAYQADAFDTDNRTGWSVVVTGIASLVEDGELLAAYQRVLQPWVDKAMHHVLRIEPGLITGYELLQRANNGDAVAS